MKLRREMVLRYNARLTMITLLQLTYLESSIIALGYECVRFLCTASIGDLME